jgi:hypothetical protein
MTKSRDDRPVDRPRDADDWWPAGRPRETLIDRQIRAAMEEGAFDNLPHHGKPLPNDENPYATEWGLAFHMLKSAGFAPPWIEADKEVRELLGRRDDIVARAVASSPTVLARRRAHAQLELLVQQINAAIARVNSEAPSLRQHRQPLSVADELRRYDEACARGPDDSGQP